MINLLTYVSWRRARVFVIVRTVLIDHECFHENYSARAGRVVIRNWNCFYAAARLNFVRAQWLSIAKL